MNANIVKNTFFPLVIFIILMTINIHTCLALDTKAQQLIDQASEQFTSMADYTCRRVEEYESKNLKISTGLTEADFDPANPEYAFR